MPNDLFLEKVTTSDLEAMVEHGHLPDHLFEFADDFNARFGRILASMRKLPGSAHIKVIGDIAAGVENPEMVEVFVDTAGMTTNDIHDLSVGLMKLAMKNYRCVSPYMLSNGILYTRAADMNCWAEVRVPEEVMATVGQGLAIHQVSLAKRPFAWLRSPTTAADLRPAI